MTIRTVEGPFFRRVRRWRRDHGEGNAAETFHLLPLYERLRSRLVAQLGEPQHPVNTPTVATRDGSGIVFVAHDGAVYPSGFLPIAVGNVRERALLDIYRESALLRALRAAEFAGPCGMCPDRLLCGGSRARAYSAGDLLGSDPGCLIATFPTAGYAAPAIAGS
jgi:radical SAM protein with 4Fe4S-binding SPASM domain